MHGVIYELSLVLAGANPGAFIDSVMAHGETSEDRTIIGYDENIMIYHSAEEDDKSEEKKAEEKSKSKEDKTSEEKPEEVEETIEQVFNTLNEKQKNVVYAMIGQAMGETDKPEDKNDDDSKGGNTEMKHNVFDNDKKNETGGFLTHSAQEDIIKRRRPARLVLSRQRFSFMRSRTVFSMMLSAADLFRPATEM